LKLLQVRLSCLDLGREDWGEGERERKREGGKSEERRERERERMYILKHFYK
jgi:hypothetical protein